LGIAICVNREIKLDTNVIETIKPLLAKKSFAWIAWYLYTKRILLSIYKKTSHGDAPIIEKFVDAKIVVLLGKSYIQCFSLMLIILFIQT